MDRYRNFCSLKCRGIKKTQKLTMDVPCAHCGLQFRRSFSQIKVNNFCGRICREKYKWKHNRESRVRALKASPSLHTEARRRQLDEARTKKKPMTEECRERIRQARLQQRFPIKMTKIERLLHDEFSKRRLAFEMHKTMFGRYQPDFVFENAKLIVQADGDYWHSRPGIKERDEKFNSIAYSQGYSVFRFAESVILKDSVSCARSVTRFIHSREKTNPPAVD